MTVRTRLVLSMAAIAAVLVVPAVYGLSRLHEVQDIAGRLEGQHAAAQVALGEVEGAVGRADRLGRQYVALGEPSAREQLRTTLWSAESAIARLRTAGYARGADRLAARMDEATRHAGRLYALVGDGETGRATAYFDRYAASLDSVRRTVRQVAERVDARSTAAAERAGRIGRRATLTTAFGIGAGLLLAIGTGLVITRNITVPLDRLRAATEEVAEGNLEGDADLDLERSDELGTVSRAFASMRDRLAELNQLRAELLGATSHRLKTPISVILGYTEMLADSAGDALDEEERGYLAAVDEQVEELRGRVDRLLKLSRVEAGELRIERETAPVRPLFQDVEHTFEPLARQQRIGFSVEVDEGVPETAEVDPDRLRDDLVGNLVENAFKHTGSGGEVSVRVRGGAGEPPSPPDPDAGPSSAGRDADPPGPEAAPSSADAGRSWTIEVTDTGEGIPAGELERIFDRYYQVGEEGDGVGLGLAVARSVAEAHGGRIEAESEPGVGSTFRVTLPLG